MNEEGSKPYFEEVENDYVDAEEIPQYSGVCSKCLGSGYRITERNGVRGVLFTSTMTDSEGKPVRRLVPCDCGVEVSF